MPTLLPTLIARHIPRRRRAPLTTIWLADQARDLIVVASEDAEPHETGGILLGYEVPADHAVVITHLIGPGPESKSSRSHFVPDGKWQEGEVARIYEASGRHTTYLGDWHSHPDGIARPSKKDERTARDIAKTLEARIRNPLMLIAASDKESWRIAAYRFDGSRLWHESLKLHGR
jgi:integrative and conjugative element protein (TIGR02256 family)